ncbi:hypothetical protein ACFQH6_06650 [Halobacteriaceae archaeon GCM10025711]
MKRDTSYHRYRQCPDCEMWWRRTGRHRLGFVDDHLSDVCPDCSAS